MAIVTTAYKPKAKIIFNKRLKETKDLPDKELHLEEFIDIKGQKAQGNQLTKLKVKEIELLHAIEGDEPWPEVEYEEELEDDILDDQEDGQIDNDSEDESSTDEGPIEVEWDLTGEDEQPKIKKNPIKDPEDEDQTSLF